MRSRLFAFMGVKKLLTTPSNDVNSIYHDESKRENQSNYRGNGRPRQDGQGYRHIPNELVEVVAAGNE
jgi:hypothetical protein